MTNSLTKILGSVELGAIVLGASSICRMLGSNEKLYESIYETVNDPYMLGIAAGAVIGRMALHITHPDEY